MQQVLEEKCREFIAPGKACLAIERAGILAAKPALFLIGGFLKLFARLAAQLLALAARNHYVGVQENNEGISPAGRAAFFALTIAM